MKKKSACILLVFAAVIVLTYMTGESYYRGISEKAGLDEQEEKIYKYQYDMIVDSPDSQFWQAVYDSAKKKAASNNVLLEIMGSDRETSYNKLDYMNMSIAAKADGIILQYNGEAGLEEAINTAVRNGIPVVTVMSDAVHSRRQSFVGVSDYQLGMAYGEIVARYVNENTKKILILQKRDIDDMNESQIYTQISNAVQTAVGSADIEIKGRNLLSTGTFETEEAVTDIFQQKRNIPDILVCMDEETTECARQAVLDFNLAGKVEIIGYYTSEDILAAVEKVNPKMKETVEAAEIKEEGVEGCIIEGPISYDLAMDPASAPIKGYVSPVAGDADLLVVPDIVSGNIAAKTITVIGGGRTGGVVLGAKVPVLLVSRAASADDKYMSIVIAALVGSR